MIKISAILIGLLSFSTHAMADAVCSGRDTAGNKVQVTVKPRLINGQQAIAYVGPLYVAEIELASELVYSTKVAFYSSSTNSYSSASTFTLQKNETSDTWNLFLANRDSFGQLISPSFNSLKLVCSAL